MSDLSKYNQQQILSDRARNFMYSTDGNQKIPEDIRVELEQYVKDFDPAEAEKELVLKLKKRFDGIFNK
jgi:hypothetical protein